MCLTSRQLADKIVEILEDKKARNVSVINIDKVSILADYFVICSGTSTTHIKSLADELEFKMQELGIGHDRKEGYDSARWILLDYGSVVVHIFHEEDRNFYNLERIWSDGIFTYPPAQNK